MNYHALQRALSSVDKITTVATESEAIEKTAYVLHKDSSAALPGMLDMVNLVTRLVREETGLRASLDAALDAKPKED